MTYAPLHRHRPPSKWTNGDLAAKLGADIGLTPDEEQQWLLDTIYAETAPERPASFEVAVVSPRQNIKTSTLGIAALADLFVFGVERHLWTAHHGDTLKGTFSDFRAWIGSNQDYEEQVTFYEGHQDMAIVHTETGNRIDFQSRTGKAGRGLTGVKRITLDEALYLEPKHVGAVYPTMLTRQGAQVRIGSSAGLLGSEQLRRLRDRGRAGKDKRFAYVEYGAPVRPCAERDCSHAVGTSGCALDDRDLWWSANCALWAGRITEESVADQRASMPPDEFAREFLSWWEDPHSLGGALPAAKWTALADPGAERGRRVVFGLDVTSERAAWIAVAWMRPDGSSHVVLENDLGTHPANAVDRCRELAAKWTAPVVPPSAFEDELDRAGVKVEPITGEEFAAASGALLDGIKAGTIRHGNQEPLNAAVEAATWGPARADGSRAFQLKNAPEIGPLVAATRALHGLRVGAGAGFNIW